MILAVNTAAIDRHMERRYYRNVKSEAISHITAFPARKREERFFNWASVNPKGVTMNIEISARHFDLTDALKNHVEDKLSMLDRFYDGIDDVHVILELSSGMNSSHVQLRGDRVRLDARAKGHDMYFAFDDCASNLERQLRKFKETHHDHPKRQNGNRNAGSGAWFIAAEPSELAAPLLLKDDTKLEQLTTNQAMTEFEVRGSDNALIFYNTETDTISGAYRTSSGVTQVVELTRKD